MANQSRTLEILLKLNDQAKAPLQGLEGQLQKLQPQFQKVALVSGAAFAAVTGAVGLAVHSFADAGDELAKMAQRTGISVEALSELKYAADLSGTSIDAIELSSKKLSLAIVDLARGSQGAVDAFGLIGLSLKDLQGLKPEDAFMKVAGAVASIEDPTIKAAAAVNIFGKNGTDLIPLLNGGAEGLAKMRDEAKRLGVTFTTEAAQASEEFNDNLSRLGASFKGIQYAVASAFLPALNNLVQTITPIISKIADFTREHKGLVVAIVTSIAVFTGLVTVFSTLLAVIPAVVAGLRLLGIASSTALGPIGLVIGAVSILAGLFVSASVSSNKAAEGISSVDAATKGMSGALSTSLGDIAASSDAMKQLAQDAKDTAAKIKDVETNISAIIKDNAAKQQTYKENLAQAFVDQEDKVSELTREIQDRRNDQTLNGATAASMAEIATLEQKLAVEQAALTADAQYRTGIESELVEMRRRAGLTDFQNKVEELMRNRVLQLQEYKEKLAQQLQERADLQAHLDELAAKQAAFTAQYKAEEAARLAATQSTTAAINASMSQRMAGNANSTPAFAPGVGSFSLPRFAAGGIVQGPTVALVGEAGPEAIIPLSKMGGVGGGIHITINGDVSGTELVEKVKEALMRALRFDTKFSL